MAQKTALQTIVLLYIKSLPSGTMLTVESLYATFRNLLQSSAGPESPDWMQKVLEAMREAANRGDLPNEPRYKNDIRWAIRFAKEGGLIRHHGTPKSGEWRRV